MTATGAAEHLVDPRGECLRDGDGLQLVPRSARVLVADWRADLVTELLADRYTATAAELLATRYFKRVYRRYLSIEVADAGDASVATTPRFK